MFKTILVPADVGEESSWHEAPPASTGIDATGDGRSGVSYHGICPYHLCRVAKKQFLPACLTYGALFYIVDTKAAKMGLRGLPRASTAPIHHVRCCAR